MYVYIKDFIMLKALTPGEGAVVGEKVTFLKMPFTMPEGSVKNDIRM